MAHARDRLAVENADLDHGFRREVGVEAFQPGVIKIARKPQRGETHMSPDEVAVERQRLSIIRRGQFSVSRDAVSIAQSAKVIALYRMAMIQAARHQREQALRLRLVGSPAP